MEMIPGERFEIIDSEKVPLDERVCGTCDVAIVSGKSGSTPQLASMAEDLVKQDACVISIQNGLGNSGIIASRVGWERVLGGTTTHSAWRDADGAVHWTGRGSISLGSINSSEPNSIASEFISLLDEGGTGSELVVRYRERDLEEANDKCSNQSDLCYCRYQEWGLGRGSRIVAPGY